MVQARTCARIRKLPTHGIRFSSSGRPIIALGRIRQKISLATLAPVHCVVHVEAGWLGKELLAPVGETAWPDQIEETNATKMMNWQTSQRVFPISQSCCAISGRLSRLAVHLVVSARIGRKTKRSRGNGRSQWHDWRGAATCESNSQDC